MLLLIWRNKECIINLFLRILLENEFHTAKTGDDLLYMGFPSSSAVKNQPATQELQETGGSLSQEDSPVEDMATHSSVLAWRIPWTEAHGRLQPIGSQIVGHD